MTNEIVLVGFYFLALLYAIILHEVAHGVVALWLGDMTAKYAGRLNLSPLSHIDILGSIIIPVTLFLTTGFAFGYAKPVPYNPANLRDQKWGSLKVALAGPVSNFLFALVTALLAALLPMTILEKAEILKRFYGVIGGGEFLDRFQALAVALSGSLPSILFGLAILFIFWNVVLGSFNLIPIPPLDGSKILYALFPISERAQILVEQYGFFLLLLLVVLFSGPIWVITSFFLQFFFGLALA